MADEIRRHAPQPPGPQYPELEFPPELQRATEAALTRHPELEDIKSKTLKAITWGSTISYTTIARSLLERLSLGDAPEVIAEDLTNFLKADSLETYYLAGVGGIELDNKLTLTDGVCLAPMDDIPSSAAREFVFRIDRFNRIKGSMGHEIPRPKVALVVSNKQPVLVSAQAPSTELLTSTQLRQIEERVLMCLTLGGAEAAPVITAKTSWINHPAQSFHGLSGFGAGTSPAQQYPLVYSKVDPAFVATLFSMTERLSKVDEAAICLSVGRLRDSRLNESPADRAIDLGIALEILMIRDNDKQELSYRTALRGAFFLGENQVNRLEIYKTIRSAYDARSNAVHNGKLSNQRLIEILPRADSLCSALAAKIVQTGGFPQDWEALVLAD